MLRYLRTILILISGIPLVRKLRLARVVLNISVVIRVNKKLILVQLDITHKKTENGIH